MRNGFWLAGAALLGGCSITADKSAAEAAAGQFHDMLAAARYHDIYATTSDDFRRVTTEAAFTPMLEAAHDRMGAVRQANEGDWNVNFDNGGNLVTLHYTTQFANGQGNEEFIYRTANGGARLAGYHLTSPLLTGAPIPGPAAPTAPGGADQSGKPSTDSVPITSAPAEPPPPAEPSPAPNGGK